MKLEFVGGPLCGQVRDVAALPSSIDASYAVPPKAWVVKYVRTGTKLSNGSYRYQFASQREFTSIPA